MTVTIGINGFDRIGRCIQAHIAEAARNDVQVVKLNATGPFRPTPTCCAMTACTGASAARSRWSTTS